MNHGHDRRVLRRALPRYQEPDNDLEAWQLRSQRGEVRHGGHRALEAAAHAGHLSMCGGGGAVHRELEACDAGLRARPGETSIGKPQPAREKQAVTTTST